MVTIIFLICIPVTAFVTGYFTLKGVQVGQQFKLEKPKPVEPVGTTEENVLEHKTDKPQEQNKTQFAEMMNEWLNGESR